jgi:Amt family ammonium transporter
VSGAVAERIQFPGYLIFACFMTMLIYPTVVWWTWSGYGFLSEMGYSDFAGSGTVHLTGGSAALAGAGILGPRLGRFDGDDPGQENPFVPHNLGMVVLGTFILWFGWYGFNCGSTLSFSSVETAQQAALVAMNSTLAAAAGGITGIVVRGLETRKLDVLTACNGILAGLVAVCAGCGDIEPPWAFFVGICGSLAMQAVSKAVNKLKVDDPLDACAVHGGGGLMGLLLRPLLDKTGVQGEMLGVHCLAAVCIIAWSTTLTAFIFLSLKKLGLLNVSYEEMKAGLDAAALMVGRDSGDHDNHNDELSLKKEHCVTGEYVKVHESFMSNNKENKIMIKKGNYGKIVKVDGDGDVRVESESRKTTSMTTVNFADLGSPSASTTPASTARAEVSMSAVSTARSMDPKGQKPAKKIVAKQASTGSVVSLDDDRPPELMDESAPKVRASKVQKQKKPPMPMGIESGEHPAAGA